jgi:hypothetical protein
MHINWFSPSGFLPVTSAIEILAPCSRSSRTGVAPRCLQRVVLFFSLVIFCRGKHSVRSRVLMEHGEGKHDVCPKEYCRICILRSFLRHSVTLSRHLRPFLSAEWRKTREKNQSVFASAGPGPKVTKKLRDNENRQ